MCTPFRSGSFSTRENNIYYYEQQQLVAREVRASDKRDNLKFDGANKICAAILPMYTNASKSNNTLIIMNYDKQFYYSNI